MLFNNDSTYSKKHDRIFNVIIPQLASEGNNLHFLLSRVAYELNTDYEKYLKLFMLHPEWPSPKEVIDHYEKLKKQ